MPTYLITGANRGIGLELARQLSARGDRVIGAARTPAAADELKSVTDFVTTVDVASESSIAAMAKRLSGERIDVLINNAGVFPDAKKTSCLQTTADDLMTAFRVNAVGPLLVARALLDNLAASDKAIIVNVTSNMGSLSDAERSRARGHCAYRASKSALNMLSVLMANELADKSVTTIALHPGWVQTDMGGDQAPMQLPDSASQIINTIDNIAVTDNAKFLRYDNSPMLW